MTKLEIAQLLSDQVTQVLSNRKLPMIEPEAYDDEDGHGFDPLSRWGDARFSQYRSRWAEIGHPMSHWRA